MSAQHSIPPSPFQENMSNPTKECQLETYRGENCFVGKEAVVDENQLHSPTKNTGVHSSSFDVPALSFAVAIPSDNIHCAPKTRF